MSIPRRALSGALALVVSLALIGGCQPAAALPAAALPAASAPLSGTIRLAGSGSGYPAVRLLTEEFTRRHPGVLFEYAVSSTSEAGLAATLSGKVDLAVMGRTLRPAEALQTEIVVQHVATDAVAIAVHSSVSLTAISSADLRRVFEGKLRHWSELGSLGGTIALTDRPEDETAKVALRAVLGDTRIDLSAILLSKETEMIKAVESAPGAIGFYSAGALRSGAGAPHALLLDGARPDLASINSGAYPVTRTFSVVAQRASSERSPLRELMAFVRSDAAVAALAAAGYGRAPVR